MRRHGSPQELERVRREAVALSAQGVKLPQIAVALDRHPRTIARWLAQAREDGPEAVAAVPHPGSSPKLSARQRQGLQRQLLKGAQAHGWSTDWWTAPRVRALIQQRYGVEYHVNYVPTLLKSLGWTRQTPERRAGERNEQAIRAWIHKDWPRIKKRSAA
jgi:transposase